MNLSALRRLFADNEDLLSTPTGQRSAGELTRVGTIESKADAIVAGFNAPNDDLSAERGRLYEACDVIVRTAEDEGRQLTTAERSEYRENRFIYDALDRALGGEPHRQSGAPAFVGDRGDPFAPVATETETQIRSRALRSVEVWEADDELKESATRMVERLGDEHRRGVAVHLLLYGSPAYRGAFSKWSQAPETFVAELEPEEHRAWVAGQQHMRATLGLSGAVLPSPLDPSIVLTNVGATNPMRELCRVDQTDSNTKRYITSAGSSFSYDAELAEVSDDTHTESEVTVEVHKWQGWIEASIEAAMDQPEISTEIAKLIADGKARLEADKFVTGTGTNEPTGIQVELAGGSSEVDPATAEVFASADVYSTIEALPPRFRANARWMAELSTINAIDQFETSNGAKLFPGVGDRSPVLLRRRLHENSSLDPYSGIDTGATASNLILYVGDWSQYVILDRVGVSVTYIEPGHLRGSNDRPDGRVGWYIFGRNGGESLVDAAFRVLNIATAA